MPTIEDVDRPADVVCAFQLLEHVVDPLAVLHSLHAALRPDGLLAAESWDRGSLVARVTGPHWQVVAAPSVVWLFDACGLMKMAEAAGFRDVRIQRTEKAVSVGQVASQVATATRRLRRPLNAVATSRLGRTPLSYRMADLVVLTARR